MALSSNKVRYIEELLIETLRDKFQNYNPEPAAMPFYTRLLGKDRMALYSFIQSLVTNFGMGIIEQVACALAENNFAIVKRQVKAGEYISEHAQLEIQNIIDQLITASRSPDKLLVSCPRNIFTKFLDLLED